MGLERLVGVDRSMGAVGLERVGVAQSKVVAVWVGVAWVVVAWVGVGLCISLGLEDRLDQVGEDRSAGV